MPGERESSAVTRTRLLVIYDAVERRARATSETHAWWPCRRGCDTCCRRLADVPQLVRAEWALLEEGLAALAPDVRAEVAARIERLADEPPRGPITCPMLDEEEGACLVYAHRPGACRTYGFYVERELGLHCALVTDAVAEHEQVTEVVLRAVAALGGSISSEHGVGRAKANWLHLTRSEPEIAAMRAVKLALDPQGLLNPGVLFA